MTLSSTDAKRSVKSALEAFQSGDLSQNAITLFTALGYNTRRSAPLSKPVYSEFKSSFVDGNSRFSEEKALVSKWKYVDLLFQITHEEITKQFAAFKKEVVTKKDGSKSSIESFLFFVIELKDEVYNRSTLSHITREVNKLFPIPAIVLFKHGPSLTLAVINHRLHKRDENKDVLEKVTLIKDINIEKPHRPHTEILFDLSFDELKSAHGFTNFVELYDAWQKTLDTKELGKKFYKELSNWYFWAMKEVDFPGASLYADKKSLFKEEGKEKEHNAPNLIRLLTRLLFVWFVKEKGLIPEGLFDEKYVGDELLLNFQSKKSGHSSPTKNSCYYRAVLQNLFFATLNQTKGKREFRKSSQHMNVTNLMRYERYFRDSKKFVQLVEQVVPFMNGGLFECLDKPDPDKKGKQGGDVIIYLDGFSDRDDNTLQVPDHIFFGSETIADLSKAYGDNAKEYKNAKVEGLISILKRYKFTVAENTPLEEEVALDPELLGKVFENLLASYNPETKTTARKKTGSFYTPREIVNYMVDESLVAHLKHKLEEAGIKDKESGLRDLISYSENQNPFNTKETKELISAIDDCKILDPACGSGAFPMGILHKLVHCLHKLDPKNALWKQKQLEKAQAQDDVTIREQLIEDIKAAFENNELDYGRKLYLIENCIYGIDIQPIATQISKLRFFISLIVDQKVDPNKDNFGIRPLPNLETKFVTANALISIERPDGGDLFDSPGINVLEDKLKNVRHRLFSAKTPSTKRKLREEDKALREKMGDLLINSGWRNETARQLASWDPYDQNASSPFFDPEWMFGLSDGFDVVIGNPPYLKERDNKDVFDRIASTPWGKKYHEGKMDYWFFFLHKALEIANTLGIVSFITSRYWLNSSGSKRLIEHIRNKANLFHLVDIGDLTVFEQVAGHHMLHFYQIGSPQSSCVVKKLEDSLQDIECCDPTNHLRISEQPSAALFTKNGELRIYNSAIELSAEHTLGDRYDVTQGVVQNPDKVSAVMSRRYDLPRGEGVFVLESSEFETMHLTELERSFVRPFYDESAVGKFYLHRPAAKHLLYLTKKNCSSLRGLPNLQKHLSPYRKIMEARRETVNGTIEWFQLHWPRDPRYFDSPKVVLPSMFSTPCAAFVLEQAYFGLGSNVVVGGDKSFTLKMLCALLNSKIGAWWFSENGKRRGVGVDVGVERLRQFPLPRSSAKFTEIENFVDLIIDEKNKASSPELTKCERVIDALVYELYFYDAIKSVGCEVLKHLTNISEFKDHWSVEKKLTVIKKVYKELSDPKHPASIAMAKMQEIEEIKIIESRQ